MDLVLSRYADAGYAMGLPVEEGLALLNHALDEREKERYWALYCSLRPHMQKPVPFAKFYSGAGGTPTDTRSTEDIIAMAEKIRAADQR